MSEKKKPATKSAESSSADEGNAKVPEAAPENWFDAVKKGDEEAIKKSVAFEIKKILSKHDLDGYLTLFLHDEDSISNYHSNNLYNAASIGKRNKDILLIINNDGGSIEPAYLISKSLKSLSKNKFVVAIPRKAKSAATLICLGAHEIHMGLSSQLGPIDPQIGGLPALGLVNALDTLVGLACRFPDASEMLSRYLESKLDLRILGYFNRVTESAVQYGERLLTGKQLPRPAKEIADHLVNHYKDHNFVIDIDEAKNLFGSSVVKEDTKEYAAANEIFQFLELLDFLLRKKNKRFWYCGDIDSGLSCVPLRNEN